MDCTSANISAQALSAHVGLAWNAVTAHGTHVALLLPRHAGKSTKELQTAAAQAAAGHPASRRATPPCFERCRAKLCCSVRPAAPEGVGGPVGSAAAQRASRETGGSNEGGRGQRNGSTGLQDELAVSRYFFVMHPYLFIHALLTAVEAPPASASFVSR